MGEEKDNKKVNWKQEWIDIVHGGSCCGFENLDPNTERKEAFCRNLKEEEEKASVKKG